jgi:multisubunit Na+/H+ antiporter MnhF subunit
LHELVFYLAAAWMTVLLVTSAAAMIRLRSTAGRILGLDMLTLVLVGLLVLYADAIATVEQKANDLLAQADAHRDLSASLAIEEA